MKKIILLATMFLIAGTVSAQTYFNSARSDYDFNYESKFAIEVSGNIANATKGSNFNPTSTTGFTAGFNYYPVTYPVSIVPALLFTQKGFSANTPSGDYIQRTQSIDVPVLAKFKSGNSISFFLGPQVSYIISNTSQFSQSFAATTRSAYEYSGSNLRIQGVAGVGVDITKSLSVHGRYAFDVNSTAKNGNGLAPTYRMQAWQFGFGINI